MTPDDTTPADPYRSRPTPPAPQPAHDRSPTRIAGWVLGAVVVGFMLPVAAFALVLVALGSAVGNSLSGVGLGPITTGDSVAVVRVEGTITSGDQANAFGGGAISGLVLADLQWALENDDVKAIVLRVDSPGGGVTGSAQIHEAVLAADKPVVASMASVAASGGYYVSAPADLIVARPDTVTGSIGVIMTLFHAEQLLEAIGLEVTTITSGPNKDLGSQWSDLTPAQREILEVMLDESYEEFVRVVSAGRGMDEATVRTLADGRVYTGRQALGNGLVDELGDLDLAIERAAALGGIEGTPVVVDLVRTPDFMSLLLGLRARIGLTAADEAQAVLDRFMSPVLEYRYLGPTG